MSECKYSLTAFKNSITLIVLFLSLGLFWFFTFINFDIFVFIRRVIIISIVIVVNLGIFNSIKGIKEPNTIKKIIAIIINFGLGGACIYGIILNTIKFYNSLNITSL